MPRKVFTAGEVLAAADVNEFLMDQAVQSFAGTAARGSAIDTAVEGMVSYLEDANVLSIYDGSAWKTSLATTGSVLQVVETKRTSEVATNSATYVTAVLEATITPKSTSSKILVMVSGDLATGGSNRIAYLTVFRGGTGGTNLATDSLGRARADSGGIGTFVSINYLDTPSTTSATTYSVMFRADGGFVGVFSSYGAITLLEIAG
jgi:hypothetical protein